MCKKKVAFFVKYSCPKRKFPWEEIWFLENHWQKEIQVKINFSLKTLRVDFPLWMDCLCVLWGEESCMWGILSSLSVKIMTPLISAWYLVHSYSGYSPLDRADLLHCYQTQKTSSFATVCLAPFWHPFKSSWLPHQACCYTVRWLVFV